MSKKGQHAARIAAIAAIFYIGAIVGLIYFVKDIQVVYMALLPIGLFLESNKEKFAKIDTAFLIIGRSFLGFFLLCLIGDLIYRIFITNTGYYTPIFMTCLAFALFLFNLSIKSDE